MNLEMNELQTYLAETSGPNGAPGHRPRWKQAPYDFRDKSLKIGVASVCSYPPDHPLPRFAKSNHEAYTNLHGYRYVLEKEHVAPERPPAWGKVRLLQRLLEDDKEVDWWLWFDCDTFFMNMTVTLDSLLYRYASASESAVETLDSDIHLLVAEDAAMLNTGAFLLRSSDWSRNFLNRVWGPQDSIWTDHPWWENAAMIWDLLGKNSEKHRYGIPDHSKDDLDGIYPSEVRIMPQWEFNSYHPATAQSLHDSWIPGKFALAFNGVLSNTSPEIVKVLYGNYYELACELNGMPIFNQRMNSMNRDSSNSNSKMPPCVEVEQPLPWLE
eukprot:TRINITY_DN19245_c0_g1_i1.p1 TRINITY_DN19245_c0_g1~~TRINITY_DN19245_c0_g1_i1.p1  ORF type:complete len:326 (-),score=37.94 TRINITY_DN19245_c0_g1_i1:14-991(-)